MKKTKEINFYENKYFSFKDFSSLLLKENKNQKKINKKFLNFLKKKHIVVVIFNKNKEKYVAIINPSDLHDINSLLKKISLYEHTNKRQVFIHTHGINGYEYDLINYFTDSNFTKSIKDKDICIFFNNCSSFLSIAETFKKHIKTSINRQKELINSIIAAICKKTDNISFILSGFSHGCILNTYILDSIDYYNLKKISSIFLIEEAIPKIKYLIEPLETRYQRLKYVCEKEFILNKVTLILISADLSLKSLLKYHPAYLMKKLIEKINNDKEMQNKIYNCYYVKDKIYKKKKEKKFIKIKQLSELQIKFCPQKKRIW